MEMIKKLVEMFISKKRIIGWVAAAGFVVGGAALSMETKEFKEAVCGAPVIEKIEPKILAPITPVVEPVK